MDQTTKKLLKIKNKILDHTQRFGNKINEDDYMMFVGWSNDIGVVIEELKQQFTPDWSKAPKWAQWVAQDHDGAVYWYQEKPYTPNDDSLWAHIQGSMVAPMEHHDWHETLQQRPQEA